MAAQHPAAIKPNLHYTSPRLRRDAKTQVNDITNQFHGLLSGLQRAQFQTALDLQIRLDQAEKEAAAANQRCELIAKNAEIVLEDKQKQLDSLIAMHRSSLG